MPKGWADCKGRTRPQAAACILLRSLRTCGRAQTQLHVRKRRQQFIREACRFHLESVQGCCLSSYSGKVKRKVRHCRKLGDRKSSTGQEWVRNSDPPRAAFSCWWPDPSSENLHQSSAASVALVKHKRKREEARRFEKSGSELEQER